MKMKLGASHSRRFLAGVLTASMLFGCVGVASAATDTAKQDSMTLGIYSTTDMHGRAYSINPIDGKEVKNSLLKVATAMAAERAALDATILIDNGDIIQGSPIISYNMNMEGGKENPMALCLRYIGYDAFVMGNHEFNFNQDIQGIYYSMLGDATGKYPGTPVDVLCANYIDVKTQETIYKPYKVNTYNVGGQEFKVGILGFENVNVPNWDLPSHYEGADFVHKDNTGRTYAYEWVNYWQKQLRETEKCDFVIVAAHSGEGGSAVGDGADGAVVQDLKGDSSAFTKENQVAHLIENTTGIDLVIAGHNHQPGVTTLKNAEGKEVPCVNGGGSTLTKTVVTLNKDGSFAVGQSENLDLTVYENDAGLAALMKPYYEKTLPFVTQEIGTLAGDWDDITALFHTQSDTMNLVHEAQLWASGADLSLASPVANKDFAISQLLGGKDTAPISLKDCYSFYKYDNNLLYMVEMNGKQLKDWLEDCVKDYKVEDDGTVTGGGFGTDQLYGASYDVYLGNIEGTRIQNLTYQGKPVTADQIFKVALNSYRLSANAVGDEYGWYAVTGITMGGDKILWDGTVSEQFGSVGGSVTLIIAEYIKALTAEGKQITPPEARSAWTMRAGSMFDSMTTTPKHFSRRQLVEMLYGAVGSPAVALDEKPLFTDVAQNGSAALSWAVKNGIVKGYENGAFRPDDAVTYEEGAVILANYAAYAGITAPKQAVPMESLANYATLSPWAVPGLEFCYNAGLIDSRVDELGRPALSLATYMIASNAQTMIPALLALKPAA